MSLTYSVEHKRMYLCWSLCPLYLPSSAEHERMYLWWSLCPLYLPSSAEHERMYLWWSLCPLYLLACQVRVTAGNSGLCCVCVTSFERYLLYLLPYVSIEHESVFNTYLRYFAYCQEFCISDVCFPGSFTYTPSPPSITSSRS